MEKKLNFLVIGIVLLFVCSIVFAEEAAVDRAKRGRSRRMAIPRRRVDNAEQRAQLNVFKNQLRLASARHNRRLARLRRIRELAVDQKDDSTIERVDLLTKKEDDLFARKTEALKSEMLESVPPVERVRKRPIPTGRLLQRRPVGFNEPGVVPPPEPNVSEEPSK